MVISSNAKRINWTYTTAVFIIFGALVVYLYYSAAVLALRIILALLALVVSGEILVRVNGFSRIFAGAYMARSRLGLNVMDNLARRHSRFFNALSDWGLVFGFGLLSLIMFKKDMNKKKVILGIMSILIILFFVLPFSILPFSLISIPQVTTKIYGSASSVPSAGADMIGFVLYASGILGGFALYAIVSIAYNAFSILYALFIALVTSFGPSPNYGPISNSIPGVAPIIPGITIPFFAGVLSLVLLLTVHEFSHGVLARISKIKLKSTGVLMLGIIPIGAFVEPDEKKINRLGKKIQNRISAAGVASNMLLSIAMFIPMLILFYFVLPHFSQSYVFVEYTLMNHSAYNVIAPGSIILSWNGHNVSTLSNFSYAAKNDLPYSSIHVVTNKGSYVLAANSQGKIGVEIAQSSRLSGGLLGGISYFLYTFFGLSFLLNFFVAIINLLPIPSLDGWRIFNSSIKSKKIVFAVSAFVVFIIVMNAVPWLWSL